MAARRRARSAPRYVAIAAAVALLAGGGYAGYERFWPQQAAAATITTADVQVGTITATVSATGNLATPVQSELSFKSAGRLTELLVNPGDLVEAGQPLARIDTADLQAAQAQAQASYDSAVANLRLVQAGSRPEEIAAAQAQVEAARVTLAQAQAQGPEVAAAQSQVVSAQLSLEKLLNPGAADIAAAQASLDAANAKVEALLNPRAEDVASAQSQVASAQAQLEALLNPRPEDVKNAEAAVASTQAQLEALLNPRREDLAAAQSALDQARTKLAQLQDQPKTATPQEIANAELAVRNAQIAYDKALADAAEVDKPGSSLTRAASDAAIQQALIQVQMAQNTLDALKNQGPSEWEVRQAQQSVEAAQASLDKLKHPSSYEVQQAQASVAQAQASLDKLKHPSSYEVQQAQEGVKQAQANLQKLLNPSAADVAAAQQSVAQARASLDGLQHPNQYDVATAQESVKQAQANLQKLLTTSSYEVQSAQANLAQAQANLAKLQHGNSTYDIAAAQAQVDQAQAGLDKARADLAAATLSAPYAGTVASINGSLGEQVSSGTALVTLVDTQQLRLDVVVDESDIATVKPGQPATVTLDALPGKSLSGTVSVVSPTATVSNGVVTYTVQIALDAQQAQAAGVRSGMTASAAIVSDSRQDVVMAPNRAIRTQGQARTVQVLDANGRMETRQVQVGLSNDQFTEIISGLQPGDKVVIPTTGTSTTAARTAPGGAGPVMIGPGGAPGASVAVTR
jgi:HlyD family secretion protein